VHADRASTVIFSDIHSTTQAHFKASACAAATAEEVDNDLIVLSVESESILSFEIEGVLLLMCGHGPSSPAGVSS
jgi:uncharacterized protein YjiK